MAPQSRHPGLDPGSILSSMAASEWLMSALGGKNGPWDADPVPTEEPPAMKLALRSTELPVTETGDSAGWDWESVTSASCERHSAHRALLSSPLQ